ncbi:LORF2 protein, partial [Crocuta crocuta]
KIELPYNPTIPLLDIYQRKQAITLEKRGICTLMLISSLFTIAKLCKQSKCPSTDEWNENYIYVYIKLYIHIYYFIYIYYSALKKKKILSFATTWINSDAITLNE